MEDQYFGQPSNAALKCIHDFEQEMWKLGATKVESSVVLLLVYNVMFYIYISILCQYVQVYQFKLVTEKWLQANMKSRLALPSPTSLLIATC
jgi:hypothetical protein